MDTSFVDIITEIGAGGVSEALSVPSQRVALWKHRNSIPPRQWRRLVAWAQGGGHEWLTLDALARAAEAAAEKGG